jgi:hypothetical protein
MHEVVAKFEKPVILYSIGKDIADRIHAQILQAIFNQVNVVDLKTNHIG